MVKKYGEHLRVCHDTVWNLKEFKNIPNAGVSVHFSGTNDNDMSMSTYWVVDWDDVQVAGKCVMDQKTPKIRKLIDFRYKANGEKK
jgi:hypothetical protein